MCVNVCSLGISTNVLECIEKNSSFYSPFKRWKYLLASLKCHLFKNTIPQLQFVDSNEVIQFGNVYLFAVGNGQYFGGGINVFPKANPSDNLIDVLIIDKVSSYFDLFKAGLSLLIGKNLNDSFHRTLSSFTIRTFSRSRLEIDGELIDLPEPCIIEFKVIPDSINFI